MPVVVEKPTKPNEMSFNQRERDLKLQKQEEEQQEAKKHKSPFSAFYQVNKKHSNDLMWLVKANVNAYRILLFLFDHMDKYNAVMCSYNVLEEALEISESTVKRAIKVLKDHGFIYIYKSGTSNVYVTNPDLAWNSWGNNVKYCEFPANVIISASEQAEREKIYSKRVTTVQTKNDKEA